MYYRHFAQFDPFNKINVQVHINGFVSLGYSPPYPAFYPYFSPRYTVIAPFWADIDLRYTDGAVYFSKYSRSSEAALVTPKAAEVFDLAKELIVFGAGDTGFLTTQVIVVTWMNVSPYPGYFFRDQVGLRMAIYAEHFAKRQPSLVSRD